MVMNVCNSLRRVRRSSNVAGLLLTCWMTLTTGAAEYNGLIAFGDSLSDLGNLYNTLRAGGSDEMIYMDIGYTAAPGRYDNGRYSNGPLWVEHLADQLGLGPLAPNNGYQPLTVGTDFAY